MKITITLSLYLEKENNMSLTPIESYFGERNESFQNFFEPFHVLSAAHDLGITATEIYHTPFSYPDIKLEVPKGSIQSSHLQDMIRYISKHSWYLINPVGIMQIRNSAIIRLNQDPLKWKYKGYQNFGLQYYCFKFNNAINGEKS